MLTFSMLLSVSGIASAGCDVAQLDEAIDHAESAFAELRVDDFEVSIDQIDLMLECLEGPVVPETAARLHRIQGIVKYAVGDERRATSSLMAARRLDPGHPIPDSLVPPDHPVRQIYDNVDLGQDPTTDVPEPKSGWLAFDGERGLGRPLERATVVQVFKEDGRAVTARYSFPGDPMPPYPGFRSSMSADMLGVDAVAEPSRRTPVGLFVAGGVMLAAGAGGLFMANAQDQAMDDATTVQELDAAFGRQKTFGYAGYALVGTGLVGIGLGFAL